MSVRFEYGVARLRDFAVRTTTDKQGKSHVETVELLGEPVRPSKRFWRSLQTRFGFTQNIFKYFRHEEVFTRISDAAPNDRLRWCVERDASGKATLLAVTNPANALVTRDDLDGLLDRFGADKVAYHNGVVRSTHAPRFGGLFAVAGDEYRPKFVIDTPVDGFGRPAAYLGLLRQICENGAVAYAPAFRSEISVGKGGDAAQFALGRALEGFNNDEGFAALRQRFEAAARSWASVHEAQRLYKLLVRVHAAGGLRGGTPVTAAGGDGAALVPASSPWLAGFHRLTGDLSGIYGLANLDALSAKRQRTLPAACRVYDLLNYTTELATHHATAEGAYRLHAFVGQLVSGEYDLEGTADQFGDWRDFFVANEATIETVTELRK